MLCGSLEGGVEKKEPVINRNTQLKSDSIVKFQSQATELFVVACVEYATRCTICTEYGAMWFFQGLLRETNQSYALMTGNRGNRGKQSSDMD